jgi:hypothetical protein
MPMGDKLLLKFRAKSTSYGVTRETLKAVAAELDTTETMVIHLAVSRFAKEVLPAYAADDGRSAPILNGCARLQDPVAKRQVIGKKSLL